MCRILPLEAEDLASPCWGSTYLIEEEQAIALFPQGGFMKSIRTVPAYLGLISASLILITNLISCNNPIDGTGQTNPTTNKPDTQSTNLEMPVVPQERPSDLIGVWKNTGNTSITITFNEDGTIQGHSVGQGGRDAIWGARGSLISVAYRYTPQVMNYTYDSRANTVTVWIGDLNKAQKIVYKAGVSESVQAWDKDGTWKVPGTKSMQELKKDGNIVTISKYDNEYDEITASREINTIKGKVQAQTDTAGQFYMDDATNYTVYSYSLTGGRLSYGGFTWTK